MPSPLNLLPAAVGQAHVDRDNGTVSLYQPAPQSFEDPLYVVRDGWSQSHFVKVSKWSAGNGLALPAPGAAVVIIKDQSDPTPAWVCVWWDGIVPTAAGTHGTTIGYTAGTGTALTVDGATTGGLGSTAYTLGDLVLALKQTGVLKP